jgi:hypothetical protein
MPTSATKPWLPDPRQTASEKPGAVQDWKRAIALYTLNTAVSEALYTPLQMLEVALRNRIHSVMTGARHETWF